MVRKGIKGGSYKPLTEDGISQIHNTVMRVFEEVGIQVIDFKLSIYNPLQILRLVSLLKKEKYDIAHAHLFPTQYWLAISSLWKPKSTRLIKTEHSVYNERKEYRILNPIERWIYRKY